MEKKILEIRRPVVQEQLGLLLPQETDQQVLSMVTMRKNDKQTSLCIYFETVFSIQISHRIYLSLCLARTVTNDQFSFMRHEYGTFFNNVKRAGNCCCFLNFFKKHFQILDYSHSFQHVIIAENHSYASKKINYHLGLKISFSDVAYIKIGCLLTLDL